MAAGVQGILGTLRILVDADSAKADRVLQSLGGKAQVMGAAVGAAFGTAGIAALKMGDTYDAALDGIRSKTGATGEELSRLEGVMNDTAGRVTEDLGTVGDAVTSLWRHTKTANAEVAESLVDLARLTETEYTAAFEGVTQVYANWNVAAEDQVHVNDMLLRAYQATGVGVDVLSGSLTKNAATLKALGFELDDSIALISSLEAAGVDATAIMGPLKKSIANLVKAGKDPSEAIQGIFDAIKNAPDDVAAGQIALENFGAKGVGVATLIRSGTLDIEGMFSTIAEGGDTVQQASDDTRDWADGIRELINRVTSAVGPITSSFAGIADSLGNAIFLLPAAGGFLGRQIVKIAQSEAVRGAAGKAGALISRGIAMAMSLGSGIVKMVTSSGAWEQAGKIAGGRFGSAFKLAALAGLALLIADQLAQLGEVRQANLEQAAKNSESMKALLAEMPSREEAEKRLAGLKAIPGSLDGVQGAVFAFSDFAKGNILGSAVDGLFGSNPAQNLEEQVKALEDYIAGIPPDMKPTITKTADALTGALGDALKDPARAAGIAAATGTTIKEVTDGFAADAKGLVDSMVKELRTATPEFRRQVLETMNLGPDAERALLAAIGPVQKGVRGVFQAATAEVAKGFGNVRQALKNPPKMMTTAERIARQEKNLKGVMRNLRKAVEFGDPLAVKYWDRARAKVMGNLERLRGQTEIKLSDVKRAYRKAGVSVEGTWADIETTTKRKSENSQNAAVDAAQDTKAGIDNVNLYSSGVGLTTELANGLRAGIPNVAAASNSVAAAAAGPLEAHSPPKEGPLSDIDRWGGSIIDSWLRPMERMEGRARKVGTKLAGAVAPHPTMSRMSWAEGSGRGSTVHVHVGTMIANDAGIDELDRRIGGRKMRKHRQPRDPQRY